MIHSLIRLGLAIREETRMNIRYHVELSEAERGELAALVGGGKHYARKIKRAQILLAADRAQRRRYCRCCGCRRLDRLPDQASLR